MLFLKSCTKCSGDMYLEKDNYGSYRQCLQCGLIKDLDPPSTITIAASESKVKVSGKPVRTASSRRPAVA